MYIQCTCMCQVILPFPTFKCSSIIINLQNSLVPRVACKGGGGGGGGGGVEPIIIHPWKAAIY